MPGLVSKSNKSDDDKDDSKNMYSRVSVAREHSSFSDEEVMNHPRMVRLMGYLESLPVEKRILEFTSEEERKNESGLRVHETEEARRKREIEEDRKNYMNRFFR